MSLLELKSDRARKETVDEALWKGIKLCNKNDFGKQSTDICFLLV